MDLETLKNIPAVWMSAHPFVTALSSLVLGFVMGAVAFRSKKK